MAGRQSRRNPIVYVAAETLKPHPEAQRHTISETKVKGIMGDLDLDAIGTIHVVKIDGELWIVDGQHRWTSLMRLGLGEWKVCCEIHVQVTDHQRAAKLFKRLNNRAVVRSFDRWRIEVVAGEPVACGVKRVAESFNLRVDLQKGAGQISCTEALMRVYAPDGGKTLTTVLGVLRDAYGLTPESVEGKLIEGVAVVLGKNGQVDLDALAKKLAKYPGGAPSLVGDAKGLARMRRTSLPRAVAEVVVDTYNLGRRVNRLSV